MSLHAHLWAFCLESCFKITTFLCRNASQVSYWRYRIESVKDITVQSFIDQYTEEAGAESTCDPDLENLYQDDENQIGVDEMALPFILFAACFVLALIVKLGMLLLIASDA